MRTAGAVSCHACHGPVAPGERFCEACGHETPFPKPACPETVTLRRADRICAACGEAFAGSRPDYCPRCGTKPAAPRDHIESDHLIVAAASDRGRRHARNEDAFSIAVAPDGRALAVVCDGVSTTSRPDQASQAAADAGMAALLPSASAGGADDLELAYLAARQAVHQVAQELAEERAGAPSCTFLAASVAVHGVRLASVGDCRAFWLPEAGEPRTLTEDDSWAAEQVLAGTMTAEAVRGDPRSHSITRWLGRDAEPGWRPRRVAFHPAGRGRLVLCSDGLWNYAPSAADVASIAPQGPPSSTALSLVEWANGQGGHDNVTVVVIDVGPSDGDVHAQRRGPAR